MREPQRKPRMKTIVREMSLVGGPLHGGTAYLSPGVDSTLPIKCRGRRGFYLKGVWVEVSDAQR